MGRLKNGPNGGFSGKAGSIVGSSWRDIYYIKGLQKKVTKPRSMGQLVQQAKFGLAVKFLHPIKDILNMGFGNVNPQGATGYNMAISHLLQNNIKGTYPDFEIDYPAVQFTLGKMVLPERAEMKTEGSMLKLNWSTESAGINSGTKDRVEIIMYSPKEIAYYHVPGFHIRNNGAAEYDFSDTTKGLILHVYLFLYAWNRKQWSNTLYLGEVLVG